jgi:hypothetical protein
LSIDQRLEKDDNEHVISDNDEQCEEDKDDNKTGCNNEYDDNELKIRSEHDDKIRENRYKKKYRSPLKILVMKIQKIITTNKIYQ